MPVLVFAAVLAVYAWTAAPGLMWLDAPEFSAAAVSLGVAHPPGHPLPSLLGRLVAYLPVGDLAFRVNLASALAGAAAATAVAIATSMVCRRFVAARLARIAGAAAGLAFAFARGAWEQAIRAEVYAMEAALVLAALAWLCEEDRRGWIAAAFALGLAAANHSFVTLAFLVPAAVAVGLRRPGLAAASRMAAAGVLGLGSLLYLPVRAAHDTLGWAATDRLGGFLWTVSARAFQKALIERLPPVTERLADVVTGLVADVSIPAAALALLGLYALVRARAWSLVVLLGGVLGAGILGRALLGYDPDNPDARGYLEPALGALVVLAGAGVAFIARVARPAAVVALAWPAALLLLMPVSLRDAVAAEAYGRALFAELPPRTRFETAYFETTFQLRGQQIVLGERPDVLVVDRMLQRHPYARPPQPFDAAAVRLEISPELDGDPRTYLVPRGLEGALATPNPLDRHAADRIVAWAAYLEAKVHCAAGRRAEARAALARARAVAAKSDALLDELSHTCKLD